MKLTVILERIALTLMFTVTRSFMNDCSENLCGSTSEACVVSSSGWALVPYDEKTLTIADFYRDERRLQFAEFTVTINQNWQEIGVAAVVWDAVSLTKFLIVTSYVNRENNTADFSAVWLGYALYRVSST